MPAAPEPAAPPEAGSEVELEESPLPMAWALSGAAAAVELRGVGTEGRVRTGEL